MPRRFTFLAVLLLAAPAAAQQSPERALAAMQVAPGFQVELFASEPMFSNPTSIDVDHKGRVWVCEGVNYRNKLRKQPLNRKEGDRIVVLIDKTGEGKATEAVTFYEHPEVMAPIGIAVAPYADGKGQKVYVCQSPHIWVFEDKDGDLKADGPPKVLLTGFKGIDHDHGVHGINIGPDGKLYFTVGDQGVQNLQSSDGKGKKWTSNNTDCRAGTVWRCDQDGTNLELIAHNFRNNYECCVDSFGEIWLSDNDDDGNQQTRICHVMPGGDYGYHPRGPGQSHWHEEQPGIVHKTLRTGFGSPCGITFYEGMLFPEKYRGHLLHADAGPREVRAFFKKPKGAGYELDKEILLTSPDNWFRPSDVCVAPDGSVFVADWYDPGVGGHGMGDTTRGRIYRLTPAGYKGYKVPEMDLESPEGKIKALSSPSMASRSLALQMIATGGSPGIRRTESLNYIKTAALENENTTTRARASWAFLLGKSKIPLVDFRNPRIRDYFLSVESQLANGPDVKWRILYIRYMSQIGRHVMDAQTNDTPAVRRELLVTFGQLDISKLGEQYDSYLKYLYILFRQYDGQDRFYLSALNIACGTDPARRDAILADFDKHFPEWNDKVADLVFELRPKSTLARLDKLMVDPKLTAAQKARIVDILAASDSPDAGKTILTLIRGDLPAEVKAKAGEKLRQFLPGKWRDLRGSKELTDLAAYLLNEKKDDAGFLALASAVRRGEDAPTVAAMAKDAAKSMEIRKEAVRTLGQLPADRAVDLLIALSKSETSLSVDCVKALANHLTAGPGPGRGNNPQVQAALAALEAVVNAPGGSAELRSAAVEALAGNRAGTLWLLAEHEAKKLPADLVPLAGRLLRNSPFQGERNRALILFPLAAKLDPKTLPSPADLSKKSGNAEAGKAIFAASVKSDVQCAKCHAIRGSGGNIGPDLSMIGKKGSKENLFESILQPSKAVADQYVTWKVDTTDGQSVTGLLVQETPDTVTIRDANGKDHAIAAKNVDAKKKVPTSIMPEDLVKSLTEQDLVDLVAYMATLQTPAYSPESWQLVGPFLRAADVKAGIMQDFGPVAGAFDAKKTFPEWTGPSSGPKAKELGWAEVRPAADGRVMLPGGGAGKTVVYYGYKTVDSPNFQEVSVLVNYDGQARVWANGVTVHTTTPGRKPADGPDTATVQLKRGANVLFVKFATDAADAGFTFTILSGAEVKGK